MDGVTQQNGTLIEQVAKAATSLQRRAGRPGRSACSGSFARPHRAAAGARWGAGCSVGTAVAVADKQRAVSKALEPAAEQCDAA